MPEQISPALRVEELPPGTDDSVADFLRRVPRGEYVFLKDDLFAGGSPGIGEPIVFGGWRSRPGARVLVAYLDGELAGLLAVVPGLGWSQHVGELRLVVDPAKRGRGVAATLARGGLASSVTAGLEKLSVHVLADQSAVAGLFQDLGFVPEALLADHVRDDTGTLHDLLVLAHPVEPTWSTLATVGILEEGPAR